MINEDFKQQMKDYSYEGIDMVIKIFNLNKEIDEDF